MYRSATLRPGGLSVRVLLQAYQNERNAPEALKYEENLVERIQSRIQDRVRTPATHSRP